MTSRFYGNCDVQEALQTGNFSVDFSFLCVYWSPKEHFTIQVTLEKLCREAGWQHSAPPPPARYHSKPSTQRIVLDFTVKENEYR